MAHIDKVDLVRPFDIVLAHLPLHGEEGGYRDKLAVSRLVDALVETGIQRQTASVVTDMVERLLDSLSLLDRIALSNGEWYFVSFPASLMGRSVLEALATPDQAILPRDYWDQGDYRPQSIKEEQRRLLHQIECERVRFNPLARPIRVVHVAWALIRLRNKFLLHRREDITRPMEKTHVLPGGRFYLGDIPDDVLALEPNALGQVFHVDSSLVEQHIDRTLVREIHEELELKHGEHYSFQRWLRLPPYRQVSGAGNRHAYTEYGFQIYFLHLTSLGEVRLLEREAKSSTLKWFSAEELTAPYRSNGDSAYIEVLHAAWGNEISKRLAEVPESVATNYAFVNETETIDLPALPNSGIQLGKPGKEKSLPLQLRELEWQLLLLLGWHVNGFTINVTAGMCLLGGGWVLISDDDAREVGNSLHTKLHKLIPGLIEIRDGCYFSLRIHHEILMFGAGLFSYRIDGSNKDGGIVTVKRKTINTTWAELVGETIEKSINGNTVSILRELERGDDPTGAPGVKAGDWEKNLREQLYGLKKLGLRRMWTRKHNTSSLVEHLQHLSASD